MNDTAQIIVAIATLVTALTAAIVGIVNAFRITQVDSNVKNVASNVQTIEQATNSMKDQLVAATAKASLIEGTTAGNIQGRADEQAEFPKGR
jgi:hypothetical protein